jgi:hypothetical protein
MTYRVSLYKLDRHSRSIPGAYVHVPTGLFSIYPGGPGRQLFPNDDYRLGRD